MVARHTLVPWLVGTVFLTVAVPALSASPRSLVATVQRVSDGDTIIAMTADGTKLRLRLLGIGAPEIPPTARSSNSTGLERGFR